MNLLTHLPFGSIYKGYYYYYIERHTIITEPKPANSTWLGKFTFRVRTLAFILHTTGGVYTIYQSTYIPSEVGLTRFLDVHNNPTQTLGEISSLTTTKRPTTACELNVCSPRPLSKLTFDLFCPFSPINDNIKLTSLITDTQQIHPHGHRKKARLHIYIDSMHRSLNWRRGHTVLLVKHGSVPLDRSQHKTPSLHLTYIYISLLCYSASSPLVPAQPPPHAHYIQQKLFYQEAKPPFLASPTAKKDPAGKPPQHELRSNLRTKSSVYPKAGRC